MGAGEESDDEVADPVFATSVVDTEDELGDWVGSIKTTHGLPAVSPDRTDEVVETRFRELPLKTPGKVASL